MSTSARKAATGLLVLAAASLLLLALPAAAARALKSETPVHRVPPFSPVAHPSLSGAQAARRLKQEDAMQDGLVGHSKGSLWCITLDISAPGSITLQPHEWVVSRQAAIMPDNLLLAAQRSAWAPALPSLAGAHWPARSGRHAPRPAPVIIPLPRSLNACPGLAPCRTETGMAWTLLQFWLTPL
jgi:hypothetical protein